MKLFTLLIASNLLGWTHVVQARSDFDEKLDSLTKDIAVKIADKELNKLAVWDFTDLDGKVLKIGKYIADEISVNLSNANDTFHLVSRNHLNTILKEHKLKSDGFIDPATAIELGKIAQVGAIVTGTVVVFSNRIRLSIQVLDTKTADIIAATKGELPLDDNAADLLGIRRPSNTAGVNNPVGSGDNYNSPESVDEQCETNSTGDYCFTNNSSVSITVNLTYIRKDVVEQKRSSYQDIYRQADDRGNYEDYDYTLTVEPSETKCLYAVASGVLKYEARTLGVRYERIVSQGQIRAEKCKSKTTVISF